MTRAGRMIADLLADHVEPDAIGQIAAEVIGGALEYPKEIAGRIAPYAARSELPRDDGQALLGHLLILGGHERDAAGTLGA